MPADRLDRVQRIIERASRVAPELRERFVRRLCGTDEQLATEAIALLPHYDMMNGFEPPRPHGSWWGLPGTTTFAKASVEEDPAESEPVLPFCLGQYRAVELLGRGGMGVVYRGVHATLRRPAAIKLLRRGYHSLEHRRRFVLEVEILRRLQHKKIAQLIYADTFDSPYNPRPYFVMEYVPGLPLTKYAAARELDVRARIALLVQVCEALDYAHQRGIVHCDLKPANILVVDGDHEPAKKHDVAPKPPRRETTPADPLRHRRSAATPASDPIPASATRDSSNGPQVKILDFGVARIVALQSPYMPGSTATFAGTPAYASPEQIAGSIDDVKPGSDVYSLGVIAYELLTGLRPACVDGRLRIDLGKVRLSPDGPDTLLERQFRHELSRILLAALQRNPARRLADAGPLGCEFDRLLDRFPAPSSRWRALRRRIHSLFTPSRDWGSSTAGAALRVVFRSRVAAAVRPGHGEN